MRYRFCFRSELPSKTAVIRLVIAVGITSWLAGCGGHDPVATDLPAGAIKRGEDFYLVPIGPDKQGCMMYRGYSPTRLVTQVIHYADGKGGFTMNVAEAACGGG